MNRPGWWDLVGAFCAEQESRHTRDAYRRDLTLIGAHLGCGEAPMELPVPIGVEADGQAIAAARAFCRVPLAEWQRWRDGLDGALSTRRRRVACLRAFGTWVGTRFRLEPATGDLAPPHEAARGQGALGRELVSLSADDVTAMCEAARTARGAIGARNWALVETLYGCGLRASEAVGLNLADCHLDSTTDPYLVVIGKGAKVRQVSVPPVARRALRAYIRTHRAELRRHATSSADGDALFLSGRGRRLGRTDVWRIIRTLGAAAGVDASNPRIFPHALRHSCATHLVQAGVDIRQVQAHLGHSSPVTTEVYTHISPAHLHEDFRRAHPRATQPKSASSSDTT